MAAKRAFTQAIVLLLIFLLCAAIPAAIPVIASGAPAILPSGEHILIATTDNGPVSIDRLLYLAFKEAGYNVDFVCPAIREGYIAADEGTCDGVVAGYPGLDSVYENLLRVPFPLEQISVRVFSRENSGYSINNWSELEGLRVGILENRTYILERLPENAEIITKLTNRAVLDGIIRGEYDVAVLAERDHEALAAGLRVETVGIVDHLTEYLYVNKSRETLIPRIVALLEDMKADGSADRILLDLPLPEINPKKTVLHIVSNNTEIEREDKFSAAMKSRFADDTSIEWKTVNLDDTRFPRDQYNTTYIAQLLRADCVARNVVAIIASGDPALAFLADYYYLYFRNVPVLFYGVDEQYEEIIYGNEDFFTGIVDNIEAYETLSAALAVFPNTNNVFVVNDYTSEGSRYRSAIAAQLKVFEPTLNIEYNDDVDCDLLMTKIKELPPGSLVIFGSYFVDGNGQYYALGEMKRLLERDCSVPILSFYSDEIAYNAIGGKSLDYSKYGEAIADMLEALLLGGWVGDIPVESGSSLYNSWVFDKNQLDSFNISVKSLPADARILNVTPSIWEANPELVVSLVIILLVGVILIIGLVSFRAKDKKRNKQIEKSDSLLRAVNAAASVILASGDGASFEDSLMAGMALMGRCLDVDRVQLWQNATIGGELCFIHKHEWLSETGMEKTPVPIGLTFRYSDKPGWHEMFLRGEHINGPFSMLPENDQIFLSTYEIKSIVVIPLFLQEQFWGFFSIDDCRAERIFTDDEIDILRSASLMLASAINQTAMTQDIQATAAQLEIALSESNQANLAKSTFIANMSHEIRTPMNSIIGFSELAIDTDIKPETKEYLESIITNSNWLLTIINDVLDVSKIEAGKMELESVPFDLHEIFTHCQTLTVPKAIEKGLVLHFYAEPVIGKKLLGDPTRLHQIFINLLSNAIKFTNIGAVKLSSFITESTGDECTVCFEIRDSGIGMSPEQIEKVFHPFTQADSSMTRKHGGTGLGLSITKNLIELMGGELMVESTLKVGSKFSFELKFKTMNMPSYTSVQSKIASIDRPTFSGEVLVCEDNLMNQRVIYEHLLRVGLGVEVAENGKEGIEMVRARKESGARPYDLIFMDIHMPVMDGLEAAPHIAELNTDTPILAMTANIMADDLSLYKSVGMIDCIAKPFTSQELWRCLLKYLTPVNTVASRSVTVENDEDLQRQLLVDFLDDNRDRYAEICSAISSDEIKMAHRLTHSLKNNAGLINKPRLQKAALKVEMALKDGQCSVTEEQLNVLESELTIVINELDMSLQPDSQNDDNVDDLNISSYDSKASLELLQKLEPLLKSGNFDCLNYINELRSVPGSSDLVRLMEALEFRPAALEALYKIRQQLGDE